MDYLNNNIYIYVCVCIFFSSRPFLSGLPMKAPVRPSGAYRISEAGSAGETKAEPAPEPPELDGWRYGKRVNTRKKKKKPLVI